MTEKISEFRRRMDDGSTLVLVPHKAESAVKDSEGQTITLTYATKAELQPVKDVADNAVRKDISETQTIAGELKVGGHDLTKAVTTNEPQDISAKKTFTIENIIDRRAGYLRGEGSATTKIAQVDKNGNILAMLDLRDDGTYRGIHLRAYDNNGVNHTALQTHVDSDGSRSFVILDTVPTNAPSNTAVTKGYVESTDGTTNNLVHRTSNESIGGQKTFEYPITGAIVKSRLTSTDSLNLDANYDGLGVYYLYMNAVSGVKGTPVGIEVGGAILYHSREYAWGDTTNSYTYYHQMLVSSTGIIYTRRHVKTQNKSTGAVSWGSEKWKRHSYTEVDAS